MQRELGITRVRGYFSTDSPCLRGLSRLKNKLGNSGLNPKHGRCGFLTEQHTTRKIEINRVNP